MSSLSARSGYSIAREYAASVGATNKIVGDLAWRSSRYNQQTGRGRLVRLLSIRGNVVAIWDSKDGRKYI